MEGGLWQGDKCPFALLWPSVVADKLQIVFGPYQLLSAKVNSYLDIFRLLRLFSKLRQWLWKTTSLGFMNMFWDLGDDLSMKAILFAILRAPPLAVNSVHCSVDFLDILCH